MVIILGECAEGSGLAAYEKTMQKYVTPEQVAAAVKADFQIGAHKAYAVTRLMKKAEFILVSSMEPELAKLLLFTPAKDLEEALKIAFTKLGSTQPGITLMPMGSLTEYGPFWTVAIAFFIAEMGDKTQLATVALAAQFNAIIPVWLGTTTGMMIADGIGIIIGIVLGKRIPERAVKWAAAMIFIFFGLFGLYESLPNQFLTIPCIISTLAVTAFLIYLVSQMESKKEIKEQTGE